MRRLPLGALAHFEAVARLKSFSMAAGELSLSQGAVSQQIKSLEQRLGKPLFVREHGGLRLTPEGSRLYPAARQAFGLIEGACGAIHGSSIKASLRIGSLPTLAFYWLIPRLAQFRAAHPHLEVEVVSLPSDFVRSSFFPKLDAVDVDVALTYGDGSWAGLESLRLFDEEMVVTCAPAYLAGHPLRTMSDLRRATLIQHTTRPNAWHEWAAAYGPSNLRDSEGPRFEHFFMIAQAALSGLGVALLPAFVVEQAIAQGQLVQVFANRLRMKMAYHLVWPAASRDNRQVLELIDWASELRTSSFHSTIHPSTQP